MHIIFSVDASCLTTYVSRLAGASSTRKTMKSWSCKMPGAEPISFQIIDIILYSLAALGTFSESLSWEAKDMSEKKMTITEDDSKVIQSHWRKAVLESHWIIWTDHGDMILNLSIVFFLFWRPQDWNTQRTTWRLLQRDCGLVVRLLSAVVREKDRVQHAESPDQSLPNGSFCRYLISYIYSKLKLK